VRAIEKFERVIRLMPPVTHKLFSKLFQHLELQLLQEVGTMTTSPRSTYVKRFAPMKTLAGDEVSGAVNITADICMDFRLYLSNAETEATTWSLAKKNHIVSQAEREIYGITSNEQMQFKKATVPPLDSI